MGGCVKGFEKVRLCDIQHLMSTAPVPSLWKAVRLVRHNSPFKMHFSWSQPPSWFSSAHKRLLRGLTPWSSPEANSPLFSNLLSHYSGRHVACLLFSCGPKSSIAISFDLLKLKEITSLWGTRIDLDRLQHKVRNTLVLQGHGGWNPRTRLQVLQPHLFCCSRCQRILFQVQRSCHVPQLLLQGLQKKTIKKQRDDK